MPGIALVEVVVLGLTEPNRQPQMSKSVSFCSQYENAESAEKHVFYVFKYVHLNTDAKFRKSSKNHSPKYGESFANFLTEN